MKITYNWLKEYIDFPWDCAKLVERLTLAGLEDEGIQDLGNRFDGVVIGHVLERQPHPDADRLSVCRVDLGDGAEHTIVCGAPNVDAGQKVAVIQPGFCLPDGTKIKKSKIRGVPSAGMICSEVELEIGDDASGIMVLPAAWPLGTPFAQAAGLQDTVLEFEVTANRPDWLSVFGIAREVGALGGGQARMPEYSLNESGEACITSASVAIDDPQSCRRYVARIIRGVQVGPSPAWLQVRLTAVGLRPINNIVDITNFVMFELGQPLHAFDLAKLEQSRLIVRRAQTGETLKALDGRQHLLDEDILVIADGRHPVALAGIIGGHDSEVTDATTDILLESAYFDPKRVRLASARLGLRTDASARFERGTDCQMPLQAATRAAALIADLASGQVAPKPLDVYPRPWESPSINARISRINQLLGTDLDAAVCSGILQDLGCQVDHQDGVLTVKPPSFRPDLEREADITEEVGRVYGYDNIPAAQRADVLLNTRPDPQTQIQKRIRRHLTGLGFDEVVTNTIIVDKWLEITATDIDNTLRLANPPVEGQTVLRPSLIPSLLDVARRNFRQQVPYAALFEIGKVFPGKNVSEKRQIAALWGGRRSASPWAGDQQETDILDLKGALEVLLADLPLNFSATDLAFCRPGHCARITLDGSELGFIGEVRPALGREFDIERPLYIFQLDLATLITAWKESAMVYQPLPKFPPVERDLAFVLRRDIPANAVLAQIQQSDPNLIESVELFDLYEGDQIEPNYKSLAFKIRLRSATQTLDDRRADRTIGKITQRLARSLDARLR
jgi:phenylalanyl-tRNA synthetase beta chain